MDYLRRVLAGTFGWLRGLFGQPEPADPPTEDRSGWLYPSVDAFRDHIFDAYHFQPAARALLAQTRITIRTMRAPDGGGFWYGPRENRVELFGVQDEAAVHELAHAWADLSGFYDEMDPQSNAPWPTLNRRFRADVRRGADEPDQRFARIIGLCRDYEYGNPALDFPGMFENDSERFAGLASGSMGDISLMPPYLRPWYSGLFREA